MRWITLRIGRTSMPKQPIGVNVNKTELDSLIKKLSNLGDRITERMADEIEATTLDVETDAKMSLAASMSSSKYSLGGLMSSIHSLTDRKTLAGIAYTNIKYAPYIEFGTGGLIKIPAGFEEFALQFKGKGIKKINLPARPYMYPALFKNQKMLFERLKNILDGLEKS